jgi:hypothetical protein
MSIIIQWSTINQFLNVSKWRMEGEDGKNRAYRVPSFSKLSLVCGM